MQYARAATPVGEAHARPTVQRPTVRSGRDEAAPARLGPENELRERPGNHGGLVPEVR